MTISGKTEDQVGTGWSAKHRIKDICETRVHYGYRRAYVLLVRDGWAINAK